MAVVPRARHGRIAGSRGVVQGAVSARRHGGVNTGRTVVTCFRADAKRLLWFRARAMGTGGLLRREAARSSRRSRRAARPLAALSRNDRCSSCFVSRVVGGGAKRLMVGFDNMNPPYSSRDGCPPECASSADRRALRRAAEGGVVCVRQPPAGRHAVCPAIVGPRGQPPAMAGAPGYVATIRTRAGESRRRLDDAANPPPAALSNCAAA